MKRDCGPGELKPIKFVVVSTLGQSDDEQETKHSTLQEAVVEFGTRRDQRLFVKCSDVRLYAKDKQGYMNCILSWMRRADDTIYETNRLAEL